MEVEFAGQELRRLAEDKGFFGQWSVPIARAYRKRLVQIVASVDERDLRFPGGNHFERLQGDRNHQWSMRINDQWRLILEIRRDGTKTIVRVVDIEDYH
jgi:proteic killer suppression protein